MRHRRCTHEDRILREGRDGSLSREARLHLTSCEACSAALRVDGWLQDDGLRIPPLDDLPDPMLIWWRSRQERRLRQTERATLPIQFAERLALVLGGLGLITGASMTWPVLRSTFGGWASGWLKGLSQALPLEGSSLTLALFCSLFLLAAFGLYSQWAER